ncbi:hypothetical protein [Budvicia aquatica]|nr:hypothetical protein [Budvicia aquatica]
MDTASVGLQIMMLIACSQLNIVDLLYPKVMNSIITGDVKRFATDDDGEIESQKMFVLAMEMLSSEKQSTIDWASAGIPIERFYYDFVKEALYSTDETILKEWLNGLCDQHLKWCARAPDIMEEATFMGYEVPDQLHLWPFEYHAVINIRARHGLSTPVIDHPLLTNNFKNMAIPDFSQWEKPTWFTEVSEELIRINPDLAFTRDLF